MFYLWLRLKLMRFQYFDERTTCKLNVLLVRSELTKLKEFAQKKPDPKSHSTTIRYHQIPVLSDILNATLKLPVPGKKKIISWAGVPRLNNVFSGKNSKDDSHSRLNCIFSNRKLPVDLELFSLKSFELDLYVNLHFLEFFSTSNSVSDS